MPPWPAPSPQPIYTAPGQQPQTRLSASIYFLGGLGFVALGVVGLYIGRIFEETKRRPLYVIKESINLAPSRPAEQVRELRPVPPQDARSDYVPPAAQQIESL